MPLVCGGPDAVSNLQWQTIRDAKTKEKWETKGCALAGFRRSQMWPRAPGTAPRCRNGRPRT